MAELDRRKHQWDMIERVLGGVRASIEDERAPEIVGSEVHDANKPQKSEHSTGQAPHDRHEEYESDRRGEHKYPHNEQDEAERPSQRDRDELKKRLEKQS